MLGKSIFQLFQSSYNCRMIEEFRGPSHPGIILPWPGWAWVKRLVKAIILVLSCPGSWLVPSSWHHPGNLKQGLLKNKVNL